MALRATMSDLIARTRRYIGDPNPPASGGALQFQDQDIQDQLDLHRFEVRYAPLRPGPTLQPGALYDYLDYYASVGNWENDELLSWVNFATLTPTTADRISGHWTLPQGSNPAGVYPPVYITGHFYDLWAAAADLLENWAATMAASAYDFSSDGQSFKRSQLVTAKITLAQQYRRKQMATSHSVRRADSAGPHTPFSLSTGGPGDVGGQW